MVELHFDTPLKNNDQIGVPLPLDNIINFTGGVQVDLKGGFQLGAAVVIPVTSPRPFDVETIARLNFRF